MLGHEATLGLCEASAKCAREILQWLDDLEKDLKPSPPKGSSSAPIARESKPKSKPRKTAHRTNEPSKFNSISFLQSVLDNGGLSDRRDGSQAEYDLASVKDLLEEKKKERTINREAARLRRMIEGPKND